jgi:hypothetical protein
VTRAATPTRVEHAFHDYLELGDGRSLEALAERYQSGTESVPTRRLTTLKVWSATYHWQRRLRALADQQAAEAEHQYKQARRAIMGEGLARDHVRVRALKRQAQRVEAALLGIPLVVVDPNDRTRTIAPACEAVVLSVRLLHEFRGLLADLAAETGGRQLPKAEATALPEILLEEARTLGFTEEEAREIWNTTPEPD